MEEENFFTPADLIEFVIGLSITYTTARVYDAAESSLLVDDQIINFGENSRIELLDSTVQSRPKVRVLLERKQSFFNSVLFLTANI